MSRSRREKYQLTVTYIHVFDSNYDALLRRLPFLKVTITNLRNCPLARPHIVSIFDSIPSLFYNLVTGSSIYPAVSTKGVIRAVELHPHSPIDWREMPENASSLPLTLRPAGAPTASSSSSLPKTRIPVHPEQAELVVLKADPSNGIHRLLVGKQSVTRVISPVDCTEGADDSWRVSDYSADGCMLMSVHCRFTTKTVELAKSSGLWLRETPGDVRSRPAPTSKLLRL